MRRNTIVRCDANSREKGPSGFGRIAHARDHQRTHRTTCTVDGRRGLYWLAPCGIFGRDQIALGSFSRPHPVGSGSFRWRNRLLAVRSLPKVPGAPQSDDCNAGRALFRPAPACQLLSVLRSTSGRPMPGIRQSDRSLIDTDRRMRGAVFRAICDRGILMVGGTGIELGVQSEDIAGIFPNHRPGVPQDLPRTQRTRRASPAEREPRVLPPSKAAADISNTRFTRHA